MRYYEILEKQEDSYTPPDINVGDEVMLGKFKNRKAVIKGISFDKNGQPVLKTSKGNSALFKPRIKKLMDKND